MDMDRLKKQLDFVVEIDKAKNIFRQTYLSDGKRKENDAEHSWHIAIMAFLLSEYFEGADVTRVMKMVLMHDLVEIDAGDTYCYDSKANEDKAQREQKCAERIYSILPQDQAKELKQLWEEFEEGKTVDANFAIILDRLQPILLNYASNGIAWKEHSVYKEQVLARNERILNNTKELSEYFKNMIENAVQKGYLKEK